MIGFHLPYDRGAPHFPPPSLRRTGPPARRPARRGVSRRSDVAALGVVPVGLLLLGRRGPPRPVAGVVARRISVRVERVGVRDGPKTPEEAVVLVAHPLRLEPEDQKSQAWWRKGQPTKDRPEPAGGVARNASASAPHPNSHEYNLPMPRPPPRTRACGGLAPKKRWREETQNVMKAAMFGAIASSAWRRRLVGRSSRPQQAEGSDRAPGGFGHRAGGRREGGGRRRLCVPLNCE